MAGLQEWRGAAVSPLVGRTEELTSLAQTVVSPPAVAVVEGEAGIGKTRLISELAACPEVAGYRFLVGACRRIREPFPLGPVIEAIRKLGDGLVAASLSPVAGALRPLLPELAPLLPEALETLDDRAAERHRVSRALAEVLDTVGPVVLVLDDAHWADEHTLDFVAYLLREPPPELSLLLTFRGEEAGPAVRALTARRPVPAMRTHVALSPLTVSQTGELAAAILGLDHVSDELAGYLCERTSGLPFAIEELLALLQDQGVLVRRGGGWARRALDALDVPTSIRDQVQERLSHLCSDARLVAEAAAVLQAPVPTSVLAATCGGDVGRARRGVAAALATGFLIESDDAVVGFRHVLTAQAIYHAIPAPRREELHAHAAAALGRLDRRPMGELAHHLRHAGRREAWVRAAEAAADHAVTLGHDDEAVRLLEGVLRDAPLDAEQRGRLAVKISRSALEALHLDHEVIRLLEDLLAHELPPAVRGELRLRLALLHERSGADFNLQRAWYATAVDDLHDRPDLRAHAMVALGFPCVPGIPLSEHERWLDRVLEILPAVDDQTFQVTLLGKVAMVQVAVGNPRWRHLVDRIVEQTEGEPRQPTEVSAFGSVGANACYAGHLAIAERLLTAALPDVAADEARWRELSPRAALTLLDYLRGAWDGLAEWADFLRDQLTDFAPYVANVEVATACLALARGDLDRADRLLSEVVHQLDQQGAYDMLPIPTSARIRLALARGHRDDAVAQARLFAAAAEAVPLEVSVAWALPAVTEAMAAGGAWGDAEDLVARWDRQLRAVDAPLAAAAVPHARGVLAVANQRWPAAAAQCRAAATEYERLGCPYLTAQARELAGLSATRAGDPSTGANELRSAMVTYHDLGANWDLDRARAVARRHGAPVPGRSRRGRKGYGDNLSPREREVAELVARGRTNSEVAEELFVSVKTVEQHVSAVMRKLDVTSRRTVGAGLSRAGQQA